MKVIIVRDSPVGKVNDIVEVADGYAKNFLIKQGYALPFNRATQAYLTNNVARRQAAEAAERERALLAKKHLETMTLSFALKMVGPKVHGSVSKKEVLTALEARGIKLDPHALGSVHLDTIGLFKLPAKLFRDVLAEVAVEVKALGE